MQNQREQGDERWEQGDILKKGGRKLDLQVAEKRVSKSNFLKISALRAFFSTSVYRESLIVPFDRNDRIFCSGLLNSHLVIN